MFVSGRSFPEFSEAFSPVFRQGSRRRACGLDDGNRTDVGRKGRRIHTVVHDLAHNVHHRFQRRFDALHVPVCGIVLGRPTTPTRILRDGS